MSEYYGRKHIIWLLTKRDIYARCAGSWLGFIWVLLQPLMMMTVLWLVFSYGLKAGEQQGRSFASWFFTGNVAWLFIQEYANSVSNVYYDYSFLVKKVSFRLAILPLVRLLSASILHLSFLFFIIVVLLFQGIKPTWSWLAVPYYFFASFIYLYGLGWLFSSLNVVLKDVSQIVQIFTQILFWGTPIVWSVDRVPQQYQIYLHLNPIYYITDGYRNALIYGKAWGDEPVLSAVIFWSLTLVLFVGSSVVYKRLRKHFADLL